MHVYDANQNRIELELLGEEVVPPPDSIRDGAPMAESSPVVKAGRAFFELGRSRGMLKAPKPATGPALVRFRERESGVLRTVYHEVVVRFAPGVPDRRRRAVLAKHRFTARRANLFVPDQVVIASRDKKRAGADLLEVANDLAEMDDVLFATPNFVSEYRRFAAAPDVPVDQWHLRNLATRAGQRKGEDVDALDAWKVTRGRRAVVVAVLDDGVDVEHPNLRGRMWRNPDRSSPDKVGRDFFLPDDHPDHFNPRPKKSRFPFDQMAGNDIHGTPCAGVIAAAGRGAYGIAFGSRVLAVKIFHADELAPDERVADAIRYAATRADVLSCSWSGPRSPDIALAIEDAGTIGRKGRGSPVFCAAGNDGLPRIGYPATDPNAIAVGASTDQGRRAAYSNAGPELSVVAPSGGGVAGIFTTDVSQPSRGFNIGEPDEGGADGLHTNVFGGTSSATPLAAGVAALVLSVNPRLDRAEVKALLETTADRLGRARKRTDELGHGRVNAARAVAAAKKP